MFVVFCVFVFVLALVCFCVLAVCLGLCLCVCVGGSLVLELWLLVDEAQTFLSLFFLPCYALLARIPSWSRPKKGAKGDQKPVDPDTGFFFGIDLVFGLGARFLFKDHLGMNLFLEEKYF